MLLSGLGSVRIVKNCDLGHENAALGLRPRAAFSRPRSQFFPIRTSQPGNNIYLSARYRITLSFPVFVMVFLSAATAHVILFYGLLDV